MPDRRVDKIEPVQPSQPVPVRALNHNGVQYLARMGLPTAPVQPWPAQEWRKFRIRDVYLKRPAPGVEPVKEVPQKMPGIFRRIIDRQLKYLALITGKTFPLVPQVYDEQKRKQQKQKKKHPPKEFRG